MRCPSGYQMFGQDTPAFRHEEDWPSPFVPTTRYVRAMVPWKLTAESLFGAATLYRLQIGSGGARAAKRGMERVAGGIHAIMHEHACSVIFWLTLDSQVKNGDPAWHAGHA